MPIDLDKFKENVDASLKRNEAAFTGRYRDELDDLLGLSGAQLAETCPHPDASQDYARLISVVEEASRANVSQAALRSRIEALGENAVKIAKIAGKLAALFV